MRRSAVLWLVVATAAVVPIVSGCAFEPGAYLPKDGSARLHFTARFTPSDSALGSEVMAAGRVAHWAGSRGFDGRSYCAIHTGPLPDTLMPGRSLDLVLGARCAAAAGGRFTVGTWPIDSTSSWALTVRQGDSTSSPIRVVVGHDGTVQIDSIHAGDVVFGHFEAWAALDDTVRVTGAFVALP